MPQISIIIPVFNAWQMTRNCLRSLASTTQGLDCEIILVDNGSTDITPRGAPFLGSQLFGQCFKYIRNEKNINYGPANNQAAKLAAGQFLLLLNNDTELLPGWHGPLLKDFHDFQNIGATGPLLLYPATEPFGRTVQHLGIAVSPDMWFKHLYEGIPETSPLAQKRRFFQAITGACLLLPRKLFLDMGMFDEKFVNGLEDVDLCARLKQKGFRCTVNPAARVIHHTSQSSGRFDHDADNFLYLSEKSWHLLEPDIHRHFLNDGMIPEVTPWLALRAALRPDIAARLNKLLPILDYEHLRSFIIDQPLWQNGWDAFLKMSQNKHCIIPLHETYFRFFKDPETAAQLCSLAIEKDAVNAAEQWLRIVASFCQPIETYAELSQKCSRWFAKCGLANLADKALNWHNDEELFRQQKLLPLQKNHAELRKCLQKASSITHKF